MHDSFVASDMVTVASLCFQSSNNSYAARAVIEAPLFTRAECEQILEFASEAAQRNVENMALNQTKDEALLRHPAGWQKSRHSVYETTDLNLLTDPFTPAARNFIEQKLHARLSPLIERAFGIMPNAIWSHDMFIVRYNADDRPRLDKHTDAVDVSFNALLSDNFEGGGTRFWDRSKGRPFAHVQPELGQVLFHGSQVLHEGMPVTSGTRHILVGFLAVDRVHPLSLESTGLSWFASWFSLPYLHIRCKAAFVASHMCLEGGHSSLKWWDSDYVRSLLRATVIMAEWTLDNLAPHFHVSLVDKRDSPDYLRSMDESLTRSKLENELASWFQGNKPGERGKNRNTSLQ